MKVDFPPSSHHQLSAYYYHVNHLLPCADFCPEGQHFSCLVDLDTAILTRPKVVIN